MSSPDRLYHLALRELHAAAGATFGAYDGWSLPEQYGDMEAEYAALRGQAALLDRSHRSRFMVTGTDALDVLRAVFAGHVEDIEEGRSMRTVALDERGGIRDLALVARTGGIAYLVSGEPAQREETHRRLAGAIGADFDVRVDDRTETTCLLALVGPRAAELARDHLAEALPARLQLLHNVTFEFHGFRAMATRTSDTGEDGFEFVLAPAVAQHVVELLRAAGVPLAGRAVQEAARVEACIPAFAPDLEPGLTPAEADLDVLLGIPGGRDRRILSALLFDGETPVDVGTPLRDGSHPAGEVRSCVRSPGLRATVGLALVEATLALPGRMLDADGTDATIVAKPLYRRRE